MPSEKAQRFTKKPVTVEAIQYTGVNLREVLDFTGKHPRWEEWFKSFEDYEAHVHVDRGAFKILTLEGTMEALPGDWIIRGVKGEHYPCKPDIFAATYTRSDLCASGQQVRAAGDRPIITIYARPTQDEIIAWANSALRNVPDGSLSRAFMRDLIADFADGMDALRADLSPQPEPETRLATREDVLAGEILAELTRARAKFPGKNVTFAALVEEVGELATAVFEESADRVRKEAVQVAVMAMRMILDGDHCFEPWRAEKGLDPLDPALRALKGGE
jgi:hypothetical protein